MQTRKCRPGKCRPLTFINLLSFFSLISVSTVCISESLFLVKLMVSESRNMLINGREESESISKGISKLASHDFGSACHCAK